MAFFKKLSLEIPPKFLLPPEESCFFLLNWDEFKTEENPKYSGKVILYGLPKMRSTVTSHMSKLPLNEAWSIMRPIVCVSYSIPSK